MLGVIYGAVALLNCVYSTERYKEFKKIEKIGIISAAILGIDALVVPEFTGGRSLHEIVGVSLPESIEYGVRIAEGTAAWLGNIYHGARNFHIALNEE
jgi:hypothetical protein